MIIGGLAKFSLIDYPGKVAAVLFTRGCNFRCPFCHNSELVLPDRYCEPIPLESVFDFMEKRKGKLDGIVITGGEPTLHKDLPEFISQIKEMSYLVKLDTNGSNPTVLRDLIDKKLIDYVAMDIKATFEKYDSLTGVTADISKIKESIELITTSGIDHQFRTTVVKELLTANDLKKMKEVWSEKLVLQEFKESEKIIDNSLNRCESYTEEEMKSF